MKYIIVLISALLLFSGCTRRPQPQVVVKEVNATVVPEKKVVVQAAPRKNRKVPPLPTPEVEIDIDSMVDQATDEVIS
jgi:PBP1b-binding outer membrane lipoprotein LpoB